MRRLAVVLLNVLLAFITASSVGPAAGKLEADFGLQGMAARAPFYVLQLYIGLTILGARRSSLPLVQGAIIGVCLAIPLALWSVATECPPVVPSIYVLSGLGQGALLAYVADRLARRDKVLPAATF